MPAKKASTKKPAKKKTTKATSKKKPAKKKPAKKKPAKKKPTQKKAMKMAAPLEPIKQAPSVCRSCHALPLGSIELVSLLLVLVFSLSAVLFTSVFALEMQNEQINALEAQLNS